MASISDTVLGRKINQSTADQESGSGAVRKRLEDERPVLGELSGLPGVAHRKNQGCLGLTSPEGADASVPRVSGLGRVCASGPPWAVPATAAGAAGSGAPRASPGALCGAPRGGSPDS